MAGRTRRSVALLRAAVGGRELRRQPGTWLAMLLAVAIGVAMMVAVHLVNRSALAGFTDGARRLAVGADLSLKPAFGALPVDWLAQLRRMPAVRAAWPRVEMRLPTTRAGPDGQRPVVALYGIDLLTLDGPLGPVATAAHRGRQGAVERSPMALFEPTAVLLGGGLAAELGLQVGDRLPVVDGRRLVELQVLGLLPDDGPLAYGAVMDIATAHWTFRRFGELDRIDLRLHAGVDPAQLRRDLLRRFGDRLLVGDSGADRRRVEAMTRAYRVNLQLLSSAGLLTAGFLVWSLATLSMRRRRAHLALLRTLGMGRLRIARLLTAQGLLLGLAGGLLGVSLGVGLAWVGVAWLGGDLGAGYFEQTARRLWWDGGLLCGYLALGVLVTLAAMLAPLRDNLRLLGGAGLAAGGGDRSAGIRPPIRLRLALLALAVAGASLWLPAWRGLPLGGYLAMLWLVLASLLALPALTGAIAGRVRPAPGHWVLSMALAEMRGASQRAVGGAAAVMVSCSLVFAMTTMVTSFRGSVEDWLERVLVADLYVMAEQGSAEVLDAATLARIGRWSQVAALARTRQLQVVFGSDPSAAPVQLHARDLAAGSLRPDWPLLRGRWHFDDPNRPADPPWVYLSEVFAARFGSEVGDRLRPAFAGGLELRVGGIFRDYAHQWGQLLIDWQDYRRVSGDSRVDGLALIAHSRAELRGLQRRLAAEFVGQPGVEIRAAGELRRVSLAIFDRSFALTYVLVFVALLVGLFGVANAQAVQAAERRAQLATLGLLGMPAGSSARLVAAEAALVAAAGVAQGLLSGALMALVLVKVINRQSFGWSIDIQYPCWPMAAVAVAVVLSAYLLGWRHGGRLARERPAAALRTGS